MKRIALFAGLSLTGILLCINLPKSGEKSRKPATKTEDAHSPEDWMYRQRAYPHGHIRKDIYLEAMHQWQALQNARSGNAPTWSAAGPSEIGGRITSLAVDPGNPHTIFIGAASGGIFKTSDGGENWQPVFDQAASLAIGDLAIAPSNSAILYVGTGEANAGGGSIAYDGAGVYRSTDSGQSWSSVGLEKTGSTGKVLIHPTDPELVYVATMGSLFANNPERGLYRTRNGGQDWEQILFLSDSTGVIDLALHPNNPDILFAASWERIRRPNRRQYGGTTSGIFRSTNGGEQWQHLPLPISAQQRIGRIGLAISPVNANRIYASVVNGDNDLLLGIYRSDNLGTSWTALPLDEIVQVEFMWWFGKIYADPIDADRVYLCGLHLYRYREGNSGWERLMVNTHVDQHALYIEPNSRSYMLLGNDGGLYRGTGNFINSWCHFDNLPITQFYTATIDFQQPSRLFGGTQDNGVLRRDPETGHWEQILGGDGFVNLVDPTDSRLVYNETQYGNLRRSTSGGDSFANGTPLGSLSENRNWNTPVVLDPSSPSTLYYGAQRVYRSTDRAQNWQAISPVLVYTPPGSNLDYGSLSALAVSPVDNRIIFAGADEGSIFLTTDGGAHWNKISRDLPQRWVTGISPHPTDPNVAYVTFSGYRWKEYLPHVFRTDNLGQSWTDISAGLPEIPANDLVINPERPEQLFLATDAGVFISGDEGQYWEILGEGLPKVVVNDLDYHSPTHTLVAATYGRSAYQLQLNEQPLSNPSNRRETILGVGVFPNPFRHQTLIRLELEKVANLQIDVYDLAGKRISQLHRGPLPSGVHEFSFQPGDGDNYLCRITDGRSTKSFILLRR